MIFVVTATYRFIGRYCEMNRFCASQNAKFMKKNTKACLAQNIYQWLYLCISEQNTFMNLPSLFLNVLKMYFSANILRRHSAFYWYLVT